MNSRAFTAIKLLLEGNRRFAGFLLTHPHQDHKRRKECAARQQPFAALLGCADSRVPPEVVFDCGIGDLFVVRTAGTVLDNAAIASLEYAVGHLHVPLLIVLGHTSCGALTAALTGGEAPGALGRLLEEIRSNCADAGDSAEEDIDAVVRRYTVRIADSLRNTGPVLRAAVEKGDCAVVPACYLLTDGIVELLEPHAAIP
ncbi:MAG: carbonic anhydrase [Chitinispirillaceae bacterium]|nr:carbonic anhydrase [Chitinispirillaceae bacterium]